MYVNAVRRLYDMLPQHIRGNTDQPISGNLMPLEFLRNTTEIIRWIMFEGKIIKPNSELNGKKWTIGTCRSMLGSITSLTRRLENYQDEYHIYADKHIQLIHKILEIRKKNGLSDSEKSQYLTWDTIMKVWDNEHRFDVVDDYNREFYKAIVAVYTLCDDSYVRRVWDYSDMKINKIDNEITLSDDYNYCLIDEMNMPKKFVYNQYKTKKIYGRQKLYIPEKLSNILKNYIQVADLKFGDALFGKLNTNDHYTPSSFASLVADVFYKLYNVKLHCNILRHSRISTFLKQPNLTYEDKENFAFKCAHSILTASLYLRVDEKDTEEYSRKIELNPDDILERDEEDTMEILTEPEATDEVIHKPIQPTINKPKPVTKVVTKPSSVNSVNSVNSDDGFQTVIYNKRGRLITKPNIYS